MFNYLCQCFKNVRFSTFNPVTNSAWEITQLPPNKHGQNSKSCSPLMEENVLAARAVNLFFSYKQNPFSILIVTLTLCMPHETLARTRYQASFRFISIAKCILQLFSRIYCFFKLKMTLTPPTPYAIQSQVWIGGN